MIAAKDPRPYTRRPGSSPPGRPPLSELEDTAQVRIKLTASDKEDDLREVRDLGLKSLSEFYRNIREFYYRHREVYRNICDR